jgi:hypothetical protein
VRTRVTVPDWRAIGDVGRAIEVTFALKVEI